MSHKARILFVDDEQRVLNSMRGMFRRQFELFLASDGESAVNIAAQNQIDVIVADQRMPGMSGTELLGKVKELSPDTIRILLTGYADPAAVESSINHGEVFRYLGKPCPPKVLRDTLEVAIKAAGITPAAIQTPVAGTWRKTPVLERQSHTATPPRSTASQSPPYVQSARLERREIKKESSIAAKDVGVVLYTLDAEFAETTLRAVSAQRNTNLATSLIKVMQYMEQQSTGVLVTDITNNNVRLQGIIAALKRYVPELVTIVVSNNRDTSDMINLINCGQIFRYLHKPLLPEQLRAEISAAAEKHQMLRDNSHLQDRHAVAQFPARDDLSIAQLNTLARLQELRTRRLGANGNYH